MLQQGESSRYPTWPMYVTSTLGVPLPRDRSEAARIARRRVRARVPGDEGLYRPQAAACANHTGESACEPGKRAVDSARQPGDPTVRPEMALALGSCPRSCCSSSLRRLERGGSVAGTRERSGVSLLDRDGHWAGAIRRRGLRAALFWRCLSYASGRVGPRASIRRPRGRSQRIRCDRGVGGVGRVRCSPFGFRGLYDREVGAEGALRCEVVLPGSRRPAVIEGICTLFVTEVLGRSPPAPGALPDRDENPCRIRSPRMQWALRLGKWPGREKQREKQREERCGRPQAQENSPKTPEQPPKGGYHRSGAGCSGRWAGLRSHIRRG